MPTIPTSKNYIEDNINYDERFGYCRACRFRCRCCTYRYGYRANCSSCEGHYDEFLPASHIDYCPVDKHEVFSDYKPSSVSTYTPNKYSHSTMGSS